MSRSMNSMAIYLLPGMKAKISMHNFFIGVGEREYTDISGNVQTATLQNGFYVQDTDVGEITPVAGEPAVIYTHNRFAQNKIVYHARTGEMCEINVIAVPIHAHDSIVTGGPAYGTYFTDDETTESSS